MKKKSFIALSSALFIIAGLSGCNGGSDSVVTKMLSGLRNGFKLDSKKTIILKQFLSTENSGVIRRNYIYIKYKLLKRGLMRKFAQLLNL